MDVSRDRSGQVLSWLVSSGVDVAPFRVDGRGVAHVGQLADRCAGAAPLRDGTGVWSAAADVVAHGWTLCSVCLPRCLDRPEVPSYLTGAAGAVSAFDEAVLLFEHHVRLSALLDGQVLFSGPPVLAALRALQCADATAGVVAGLRFAGTLAPLVVELEELVCSVRGAFVADDESVVAELARHAALGVLTKQWSSDTAGGDAWRPGLSAVAPVRDLVREGFVPVWLEERASASAEQAFEVAFARVLELYVGRVWVDRARFRSVVSQVAASLEEQFGLLRAQVDPVFVVGSAPMLTRVCSMGVPMSPAPVALRFGLRSWGSAFAVGVLPRVVALWLSLPPGGPMVEIVDVPFRDVGVEVLDVVALLCSEGVRSPESPFRSPKAAFEAAFAL